MTSMAPTSNRAVTGTGWGTYTGGPHWKTNDVTGTQSGCSKKMMVMPNTKKENTSI